MRIRVALVRPPVDVLHKFSKLIENLAIGYLAAALRRDGHEVSLVDAMIERWTAEETARTILACRPDVVGMTVVLQYLPDEIGEVARLLREGGYSGPILVGGHAVSFFPEEILKKEKDVDAVISGEGEVAIRRLAAAVATGANWADVPGLTFRVGNGIRRNRARRIRDLDELGNPARDLTPDIVAHDGLSAVSTSRGCYARCTFCSVPRFYGLERGKTLGSGDWLARSVLGAVGDIVDLHRRFAIRECLIVDDEFFGGTGGDVRARSFGETLEKLSLPVHFALSCRAENVEPSVFEQLRRGGLRHVFIGLESGNGQDLRRYGKNHTVEQNRAAVRIIKDLGLSFQPGFMLFNYQSTLEEVRENLDFLRDIDEFKPVTINSGLDPHFGTPIVSAMKRAGILQDDATSMRAGYLDPRVAIAKMIADECAVAFQPYMNFIAGARSAVTFEWRRTVPARRPGEERALDAFEKLVNDQFADTVYRAVEQLGTRAVSSGEEVLDSARQALTGVEGRLAMARALLVAHLERVEGGIRYVTQTDLIRSGVLDGRGDDLPGVAGAGMEVLAGDHDVAVD